MGLISKLKEKAKASERSADVDRELADGELAGLAGGAIARKNHSEIMKNPYEKYGLTKNLRRG